VPVVPQGIHQRCPAPTGLFGQGGRDGLVKPHRRERKETQYQPTGHRDGHHRDEPAVVIGLPHGGGAYRRTRGPPGTLVRPPDPLPGTELFDDRPS